jgi:cytochrome P450
MTELSEPGSVVIADPYPALADLRAKAEVARVRIGEGQSAYLITGYSAARTALADPRFAQDVVRAQEIADRGDGSIYLIPEFVHMLNSDPPDHTRLRRVMSGSFTSKRVAALRPKVSQISDDLLSRMEGQGEVDLIHSYALPLPMRVVCELLGLPAADHDVFRDWATLLVANEDMRDFSGTLQQMRAYLADVLAAKQRRPADDILTDLLRARDEGWLNHDEVVSMALFLLVAGHETTVSLIGNATLALLRNPDQLAWLKANPAKTGEVIDEFLRFEAPVSIATLRFTTERLTVAGVEIPQGEFVMISLAGANRDPARFEDPDRLNLTRESPQHLSFGHGIHRCLGQFLGRMEGEIAIGRLLERFPGLTLKSGVEDLRWRDTMMLRGLESLPVRLTP